MNTNNNPLKIYIPPEIYNDSDLRTFSHILVLAQIHFLDNGPGCTANNRYFQDRYKLTKTTFSQILFDLEKLGKIKRSGVTNNRIINKVTIPGAGIVYTGSRHSSAKTIPGAGTINSNKKKQTLNTSPNPSGDGSENWGEFFDKYLKKITPKNGAVSPAVILMRHGLEDSDRLQIAKAGISYSKILKTTSYIQGSRTGGPKIDNERAFFMSRMK